MAAQDDTSPPEKASPLMAQPGDRGVPPPSSTATLPPIIAGKYRAVRFIAKGGMGAVYEVVHVNTGEHLALKLMLARSLLTPELVERFRREARVHSSVRSDHVVRIVDADVAPELDDAPFLVMELLEGQDFERMCMQRQPTRDEVVDWMSQLAGALDRAHEEGIVHRDLKPENLFLAQRDGLSPVVKILDFGIAKMAGEGAGISTATGQILGTPRYMAPEQAVAAKEVSSAVDRFALGLIAFRLLCGRHYFLGDNWIALLREVARAPSARPSEMGCDMGRLFDEWFAKACALDPRARFATCAEQVAALARALEGVPLPASRGRLVLPLALLAAVGALATIGWRLERSPTPSPLIANHKSTTQAFLESRPSPASGPAIDAGPAAPTRAVSDPARPPQSEAAGDPHVRKRTVIRVKAGPKKIEPSRDRVWDEP